MCAGGGPHVQWMLGKDLWEVNARGHPPVRDHELDCQSCKMLWAWLPEGGVSHSEESLWRLRSLKIHFWKVGPHLFSICHVLSALLWEQSHYNGLGSQRQPDPSDLAPPRPSVLLSGRGVKDADASQFQLWISARGTNSPANCASKNKQIQRIWPNQSIVFLPHQTTRHQQQTT
jgi:hypothetical protein